MPINPYFQSGVPQGMSTEQMLMEDLIIECLGIYGFGVYYIPRSSVKYNDILNEDVLNEYRFVYPIEMYMADVSGFQGEGSLLSKFGIEIRDTVNFVVARRRWDELVGRDGQAQLTTRPAEGDVIYFPLTQAFFEIRRVVSKNPFFQVGKLYVYTLECELMQFSSEVFDTGIQEIDDLALGSSLVEMSANVNELIDDPQSQNNVFVDQSGIINFDADNPFGEPKH